MKILLDECVPAPMQSLLSNHACTTVQAKGWSGIRNGDLLQRAEAEFDLFAIDQILGYLTWRDSKAAIIYFVRNRNLGPVLEEIDAATPDHRCYVETLGKTNDGWINFRLTLLEDSTSQTNLSILVFHFSE
ncbi:MAG TPA: hypothetical protein DCK93_17840 [Blastocatellia bacterium]|jgi:hypothetical protein|nr:hypothetical protein [Blastocatellia bacterium]HAF24736.1 hypothetical protein [Blastocatellia bacterium]